MRKLFWGAAGLALAGCGGGGSESAPSPYFGLYTGAADVFVAGNSTTTPDADDAATAGVVNRSGTFSFNVQRVTATGAEPDRITGRIRADGTVSAASLRYVDGDGVTGATLTLSGTGTTSVSGATTTATFLFPRSAGEANARRYVLTLSASS